MSMTKPEDMTKRLLPCPFCGSNNLTLQNLVDGDDYYVSCGKCEVQQIANYMPEEAVKRWNSRAELLRRLSGQPGPGSDQGDLQKAPDELVMLCLEIWGEITAKDVELPENVVEFVKRVWAFIEPKVEWSAGTK